MLRKILYILGILLTVIVAFLVVGIIINKPLNSTVFPELKTPLNIAHRGGQYLWPENSMYAFEKAVEFGVDIVELDVRPTADGNIVVMHDDTVDRTCDAKGRVDQMTLAQLQQLDYAYHFIPADESEPVFRGKGITITTLDSVFSRFPDVYFNIEIKPDLPDFAEKVIDLVRSYKMQEKVLLTSFYERVLKHIMQYAPELPVTAGEKEIRTLIILNKLKLPQIHKPVANVYEVPVRAKNIEIVTPSFVSAAHSMGQQVYVWTINDSTEMKSLLNMGVDGILSNRPDILARIIHEYGN